MNNGHAEHMIALLGEAQDAASLLKEITNGISLSHNQQGSCAVGFASAMFAGFNNESASAPQA